MKKIFALMLLGESEPSRSLRITPKRLVSPTSKQFDPSKWTLKTDTFLRALVGNHYKRVTMMNDVKL